MISRWEAAGLAFLFFLLGMVVLGMVIDRSWTRPTPPAVPVTCAPVKVETVTRAEIVHRAMAALAATEAPYRLEELVGGRDPRRVAEIIATEADAAGIDPLLIVAIVWHESRFRPDATNNRYCGMTQVGTGYRGRPTCAQLKRPRTAVGWTARYLRGFTEKCGGKVCLSRYNRGDYEVRVWRTVDWLHGGSFCDP